MCTSIFQPHAGEFDKFEERKHFHKINGFQLIQEIADILSAANNCVSIVVKSDKIYVIIRNPK